MRKLLLALGAIVALGATVPAISSPANAEVVVVRHHGGWHHGWHRGWRHAYGYDRGWHRGWRHHYWHRHYR